MSDNVIKSTDLPKASEHPSSGSAPAKKAAAKKAAAKKAAAASDDVADVEEKQVKEVVKAVKSHAPTLDEKIAHPSKGKKFIYFATGAAYTTKEGMKFTRDNPLVEVDEDVANFLLTINNFRLPNNNELEEYKNRGGL